MQNMDGEEKRLLYAHLYSYSSVKAIVVRVILSLFAVTNDVEQHWMQIIRHNNFQMFDDHENAGDGHAVQTYPISQINCPAAVFYGGADTLPNCDFLLKSLPNLIHTQLVDKYEHLDFIWAVDARQIVHSKVIELLKVYGSAGAGSRSSHLDR